MSDQRGGGITWTEQTWNPLRGCTRVSEGCRNCYAESVAARFSGPGQPYQGLARMTPSGPRWTGKVQFVEDHLLDPLRWQRPRRVFVNSMSDLFHDSIADQQITDIFGVMGLASWHQFQVLTKRPARMLQFLRSGDHGLKAQVKAMMTRGGIADPLVFKALDRDRRPRQYPLPNVWLGVSAEDQATADERIPLLLQTPAAVRWVSAEPLLGPIDFSHDTEVGPLTWLRPFEDCPRVDWVVVGGESGAGARPMHPEWAQSLQQQCAAARVPFFMKQLDGKRKALADFPEALRVREYPNA
jgi:protein gp37